MRPVMRIREQGFLGVATLRFRKTGVDLNVAEIMRKTVLNSPDWV